SDQASVDCGTRLTMRTSMPPSLTRLNVISSMKLRMRKMPRPLVLRRFSAASGSAMTEGSKPQPSSRTLTARAGAPASCSEVNSTCTRLRTSLPFPCLIALMTDSRTAMLAAIAEGPTMIHGYSTGADCASTLSCLRALGVPIEQLKRDRTTGLDLEILGVQIRGFQPPAATLDAGNPGSTIRMLSGILAAHPFKTTISGDSSLKRRPMKRIITPLERMGARFISDDGRPPLTVVGN